ncbi:MAG: N-acyl homoserine lactonase family protein [Pseudomonadota bacterium]|nr:N-acyl homoserine lactonase family protein [Pseudomonadota bacterium]
MKTANVLFRLATLGALLTLSACASPPPSVPDIKLYVFHCGNIEARDVSVFSPGVNQGQPKSLTDSCYLIRHPKGDLIWDTGLADQLGPQGQEFYDGLFYMSMPTPLLAQLQSIGVQPEDIEWLGISHFHSDHTGNANLFRKATLLLQKEEYEAAFGAQAREYGFDPDSYSQFNADNSQQLQGDHDLFGDGRVVIKRAVGHTPGHQMLYLDMPKSGPILLSGDLYHFTSNREHQRVPSFNFSKEQTQDSMKHMEDFIDRTGAQLWIQHDKEQNADIRHAPAFYQ